MLPFSIRAGQVEATVRYLAQKILSSLRRGMKVLTLEAEAMSLTGVIAIQIMIASKAFAIAARWGGKQVANGVAHLEGSGQGAIEPFRW